MNPLNFPSSILWHFYRCKYTTTIETSCQTFQTSNAHLLIKSGDYQEALKLAKAQLPNLKPRQLDPLTKQIYINAKEANRIVELARPYHLCKPWGIYRPAQHWKFPADVPPCPIHGVIYNGGDSDLRSLLPHERARIIHSWYTVKLYHESLSSSFDEEQRQVVHEQLQRVGDVQAELLDSLMLFVCENMDDNAMEVTCSY